MNNQVIDTLISLGLSSPETLEPYFHRVRDREDIHVLRCRQTGAVVLSRSDHQDFRYHIEKEKELTGSQESYYDALFRQSITDDQLRATKHEALILNKRWLDVGTGSGNLLHLLGRKAKVAHGVEPNQKDRDYLTQQGVVCHTSIEDLPTDPGYDVVTLFHVLEHIPDQLDFLCAIRKRLTPGGVLVIEVPHARDILLSQFDLDSFKRFSFWSEHLILHTRTTLTAFLHEAGFQRILIEGVQRYPLANHLRWLAEGKPNGHQEWSHLRSQELDAAYANLLARLDVTDTLLATAIV
ncbi:MAG: class I SAM-dependent methyltransferase [Magnetococcales bacterium]|nr:class I SAM-dependent methyltransferase [Magnetococcales bacterium]MBF0438438.1 class I SAM-dependent methyltransferase [Magnetococcales bacterium]